MFNVIFLRYNLTLKFTKDSISAWSEIVLVQDCSSFAKFELQSSE